ncbi:MAG: alpha-galactosidase, partial [Lachnospiraceae bacterium]|nr:alpha-galactosidase [Lachnospiraceae bacterium]
MIKYDADLKIFKLDTKNTSYIFGLDDGYLCHYYYGKRIETTDVRYLSRLYEGKCLPSENARDKNGFSDVAPFEFSTGGIGDFRPHSLEIVDKNGSVACELTYDSHRIYEGKEALEGLPATFSNKKGDVQTLEITLKDKILKIAVKLSYSVFSDTDAITRSVKVINEGSDVVNITKIMSVSLDLDNEDFDLLTLHGSW